LWADLEALGAEALIESLPKIVSGELQPKPQDENGVTYAKKITNEERIVDWTLDASYIGRLVRCFTPKPGVRTVYQGKALKLIAGEVLSETSSHAAGVVLDTKQGLDVACGDGIYRVTQIQPEGKKAMLAADYLRGAHIKTGDKLG